MEAFRSTIGIMVPSHTKFINMAPKCLTTRSTLQDASSSCLVTQQRQVLMKVFSSLKVVLQKEYKENWSMKYKCSAFETDNYAITSSTSQCLAQKKRFAVFVSGGGSNFTAIHQAAKGEMVNGDISVLVTDKPNCGGAEYARENQIPVVIYPSSKSSRDGVSASELIATLRLKYVFQFGNGVKQVRTCDKLINSSWGQIVGLLHTCYCGVEFEGVCCKVFINHGRFEVDFLLLAGYLKLIPVELVRAYPKSIINIHPSLLPAFGGKGFYGLKVHKAVIASGARYSGPTVHFVDEHYDTGCILAQRVVPVLADDTAEKLAARVLHQEHQLYVKVVSALCENRIIWREDGVPLIRSKENPDKLY